MRLLISLSASTIILPKKYKRLFFAYNIAVLRYGMGRRVEATETSSPELEKFTMKELQRVIRLDPKIRKILAAHAPIDPDLYYMLNQSVLPQDEYHFGKGDKRMKAGAKPALTVKFN